MYASIRCKEKLVGGWDKAVLQKWIAKVYMYVIICKVTMLFVNFLFECNTMFTLDTVTVRIDLLPASLCQKKSSWVNKLGKWPFVFHFWSGGIHQLAPLAIAATPTCFYTCSRAPACLAVLAEHVTWCQAIPTSNAVTAVIACLVVNNRASSPG